MALLQWKFPLDRPWPDRLAVGDHFLSLSGTGTINGPRVRSFAGYFHYGRSEL
jgi:hypothetical protein